MARAVLLLFSLVFSANAADLRDAVAALQRGDFPGAERTLRAELATDPDDAAILSLLGAALDGQNRGQDAAQFHRRALAAAPESIDVLGNFANHQMALGDADAARKTYLKIVALDAANTNANLQLARIALEAGRGPEAIDCFRRAPDALAALLSRADPRLSFSLGVALGNAGQFAEAETAFTRVLAAAPDDFNVLMNLAAAASAAGHNQRARAILETALRQQPRNPDVLFRLGSVLYAMKQPEPAAGVLAQASKIAPQHAGTQKLLALAAGDLGALDDSLAAWDRYLKLEPGDDLARRERGYTAVRMGNLDVGIADLERFAARHPEDPDGHYELGLARGQADPVQGLAELDRALALKPDFAAARSARGGLHYQMGKPEAALPDLEAAAKARPNDPVNLDRLGQTYLALDRTGDAVRVLQQAAALAPSDSKTQLHYARALAEAGQTAGSKVVLDRFRQLGPATKSGVPAGLIDYLAMTPEARQADYRARVEAAVKDRPDDAAAQTAWLKLQLAVGKPAEATARRILELKPSPAILLDAGNALLEARQYGLAKEFFPDGPEGSIAAFRALDADGKSTEAIAAIERAPRSPLFYWHATAVLIRNGRNQEALGLLETANDDESRLLHAAVLAIAGRGGDARQQLKELQASRPEWTPVWVVEKLVGNPERLTQMIQEKRAGDW